MSVALPVKKIFMKEGDHFAIQVEGFGDTREVFVLYQDGMLTFNDEHFADRPRGDKEAMCMDEDLGWCPATRVRT